MESKWLVGGCSLLILFVIFIGWIDPVEKLASLRLVSSADQSNIKELPISEQPPLLTGRIADIKSDQLTVVEDQENGRTEVIGYVNITNETKIFRKVQNGYEKITQEDIQTGLKVHVWQDGPRIMIYPAQLTADQLVIEES